MECIGQTQKYLNFIVNMRKLSNAYTRHRILTHFGNHNKLPRVKGFDDAIQMLAQAIVKMLPKCKLYTANGNIPRCARHGAECRLNWCKYKYSRERRRATRGGRRHLRQPLHERFFWTCGVRNPNDGDGGKCQFVLSADASGIEGK